MVKDYEQQLTKMGGTTTDQEGYATAVDATEDLTEGDSLTEAVKIYTKRSTQ